MVTGTNSSTSERLKECRPTPIAELPRMVERAFSMTFHRAARARHLAEPLVLGLAVTLLASACGYNVLDGSIDDSRSLDFNTVRLAKQADELLVEYLRDTRAGREKVCKVVVDLAGIELPKDSHYELSGTHFLQRVSLQRATLEDNGFPDIDHGELRLDTIRFVDGGPVRGQFNLVFVTQRDLKGWFDGIIEEIAPSS